MTNKERSELLEDKEVRRAFDRRTGKHKRHMVGYADVATDNSENSEDESMPMLVGDPHRMEVGSQEVNVVDSGMAGIDAPPVVMSLSSVGSSLQRNADGSVVAPGIKTKKAGTKVTSPYPRLIVG